MTSYLTLTDVSNLYCFQVIVSYLLKVADFNLHQLHLATSLGVTLFKFCQDLWHQKIRVPGQSCSIVCMIHHLAISVEHRLVTNKMDRPTNTQQQHLLH